MEGRREIRNWNMKGGGKATMRCVQGTHLTRQNTYGYIRKLSRLIGENLGKGGRGTNNEGERSGKQSEAKRKRRYQATEDAAQSTPYARIECEKCASYPQIVGAPKGAVGVKLALGPLMNAAVIRHGVRIAGRRKTAWQRPVAALAGHRFP